LLDAYASTKSLGEDDSIFYFFSSKQIIKFKWDGLIKKGCPADFVILDAQRWADVFSSNLKRKVFINGNLYC